MSAALLALAALSGARPAPVLAFLEGIGAMEMVLVAIVGLLLFGGKGLPDMARTVGRAVREFKKATASVEDEVRRVMHEEPEPVRRPLPAPRRREVSASPEASAPSSPAASPTPPTPPTPLPPPAA